MNMLIRESDNILFREDDIPPFSADPEAHSALRDLWTQRLQIEETLDNLLRNPLDIDYRCSWVFVSTTQSTRYSHSVDHYPDPLFHWARPEAPPPLTKAHPLRPHPNSDGSDLLGRIFVDPELGPCTVSALSR